MNCHACAEPMLTDGHGHPVHDGPCSGYPTLWTEDLVTCHHCGCEMVAKGAPQHFARCTAENPKPVKVRNRRCGVCKLWHRPHCLGLPGGWPLEPLLAIAWKQAPERTIVAAADVIGIDPSLIHRHDLSGLSDEQADRWACRLGMHPSLIWGPKWFEAGAHVLDEQFLASGWRVAWESGSPERPEALVA